MSSESFKQLKRKLEDETLDGTEGNILMVALGDSVTQCIAEPPYLEADDAYHQLFRRELIKRYPSCSFSVINAGVGGETTEGGLRRLQRNVLDHHPDLITVLFGLNDLFDSGGEDKFRRNLTEIVQRCKQMAPVILLTPNMMATHDSARVPLMYKTEIDSFIAKQMEGKLECYVKIIREVAAATEIPLADAYSEWIKRQAAGEDMTIWLANGINHPDKRGHEILADALLGTFLKSLEFCH